MPAATSVPPASGGRRRLLLWGPVVAYAAAIFIESSISRLPALPEGVSDKDGHALLYAGLGVLTARALCGARWRELTMRSALVAVVLAAVYGASDEFHQWFVPGRTADVFDWVADLAGATVGVGVVRLVAHFALVRGNLRSRR